MAVDVVSVAPQWVERWRALADHPRDRTPFVRQPWAVRHAQTLDRQACVAEDPQGLGVFSSIEWLGEEPGHPRHAAEVDFATRHPHQARHYRALVETVAVEWAGRFLAQADRALWRRLTPTERAAVIAASNGLCVGAVRGPALASLDGLTPRQARSQWLRQHWHRRHQVKVRQRMDVDVRAVGAIGVRLTVASTDLTPESLAAAVQAFHARGERAWRGPLEPFAPHQAAVDALLERAWMDQE